MDLIREFGELIDALNSAGVEYAVCGGVAVTIHGYVRTTKDIDVLIRREDVDRAVQLAGQIGFLDDSGSLSFDAGTHRERTVRRVVKLEGRDSLMLDLLLVSTILESVWQSRTQVEWEGRRVWIVSRDGLAQMKMLAGRDQDLTDLKRLGIRHDA